MKINMQLKYKISLSVASVSLLILLFISFVYSQVSYTKLIKHEKEILTNNVEEAAKEIKFELLNKLDNIKVLATTPTIINAIENSSSRNSLQISQKTSLFFKKQQELFRGIYGEIFLVDKNGLLVATTQTLKTRSYANDYWFKKAYARGKGKIFFDDRGFDVIANGYVIGVSIPVRNRDKVIGILKVNVNIMGLLNTYVHEYLQKSKGVLKIVRTKGEIVYEPHLPPFSTEVNPELIPLLQTMQTGAQIMQNYNSETLVAYTPIDMSIGSKDIIFGGEANTLKNIKGNNTEIWHAVAFYKKTLLLKEIEETNHIIMLVGLIVTLLSWIIALYLAQRISKPIDALHKAHAQLLEQEKIMIVQSRHAAMGEMISMIAHQWRQPISVISMQVNNILLNIDLDKLETEYLKKNLNNIAAQTQELSKTINDFRNFFKPNKSTTETSLGEVLESTMSVVGNLLERHSIELITNIDTSMKLNTFERELLQVFISILNNAVDALVEKKIKKPKISINVKRKKDTLLLTISDNAGGIPKDIIDEIFNPYFTTKDEKNGTGLGLYMSKTIIEKHLLGKIIVLNTTQGASFEIELPYKIDKEVQAL